MLYRNIRSLCIFHILVSSSDFKALLRTIVVPEQVVLPALQSVGPLNPSRVKVCLVQINQASNEKGVVIQGSSILALAGTKPPGVLRGVMDLV